MATYIRHIGNISGSIVGGEEGEGGTKKKSEKVKKEGGKMSR